MDKSLSIVVIGKNESRFIEQCFVSIKRLISSSNLVFSEIIYVDSRSTDGTLAIAERYCDSVYSLTGDCSASAARKVGGLVSKSDVILFLDGDMEVSPSFYNDTFDTISCSKVAGVVGVRNEIVWDSVHDVIVYSNKNYYQTKFSRPTSHIGGALMIKASALSLVGGFDENLSVWEEPDLLVRLLSHGFKVIEEPVDFIVHNNYKKNSLAKRLKRIFTFVPVGQCFGYLFLKALKNRHFGFFAVFRREAAVWFLAFLCLILVPFDAYFSFLLFLVGNFVVFLSIKKRILLCYVLLFHFIYYAFCSELKRNFGYVRVL